MCELDSSPFLLLPLPLPIYKPSTSISCFHISIKVGRRSREEENKKQQQQEEGGGGGGGAMDFHSLPRRDLQALCKQNRIPANMTNVAMADALRALASVEGIEELQSAQFLSPQKPEATAGADAPRTTRRTTARKLPAASVEPQEQQASPLPRSRRVAVKASDIMRLVVEGKGDKDEEKDLGADQVMPQTPAAPRAEQTASRTTRRRATTKEEANEFEGGAMDAITNKTPATRTAGRRTTTRRAVATSAPVDVGKEEQMVAPSRTTRRTRQATEPPAGDSIAATATLRRSSRARGGVSKMTPLVPEEGYQQEKDVETVDSLVSETKLEESVVMVQETNDSDADTCPSIADNGNQILEEVKDEKLEQRFEDTDSQIQDDVVLADDKISEVFEENICGQGHVKVSEVIQEEEQVEEVEAICQGGDETNQESKEICDQNPVEVFGVIQQGEQVSEVEAICQGEEESNQADNSLSGLEGSPVLGLVSSFQGLVISGDKQGMHNEDKNLVLQEAEDANINLLVGQVVGENLSSLDFVNNADVTGIQIVQNEYNSLELGGKIDAAVDMLEVQETEIANVSLEEVSEQIAIVSSEEVSEQIANVSLEESKSLSDTLIEGSSDNAPIDLEVNPDSDDTAHEADSSSFQKSPSPASCLLNLTGSTVEILAGKADMLKDEAFTEIKDTTENQILESEEEFDKPHVNCISESLESDANNMEGKTEQKIDLADFSLRKLRALVKQKTNNNNQKVDKKRTALTELNENCVQRTLEE